MSEELEYKTYVIILHEGADKNLHMKLCQKIVHDKPHNPRSFSAALNVFEHSDLSKRATVLELVDLEEFNKLEVNF